MNTVEYGVFARVFPQGPPAQVADTIRRAGFTATQLNLSVLGRRTLDTTLTTREAAAIGHAFTAAGVRIWGVSGTFNTTDPNYDRRQANISAACHLIDHARDLGTDVVTVCTGTRNVDNIWRAHPDNATAEAWDDLLTTLGMMLPHAADAGVRLGIEPEPGNVVRDAASARRLLNEMGSDARHLAIVLDPANLLTIDTLAGQHAILNAAFADLGPHVGAVHAKDVVPSGYSAAGTGGMDYALVMRLHAQLPHAVPVIAQDLAVEDTARVRDFLERHATWARQTL